MSQLSITLLRLGFLALLWTMVLSAVAVLRADLYGTRITPRGRGLAARKKPGKNDRREPARASTGVKPGSGGSQGKKMRLAITSGPLRGMSIPVANAPIIIGRSSGCTVVLEDDFSSSKHARVFPDKGSWYVEDLNSTNGTYLDDDKLTDPVELEAGDKIHIGSTTLEWRA